MYDIGDAASLKAVETWREDAIKFCPENVSMILVGNKCDREDRKVTLEEGKVRSLNRNWQTNII